MAAELERALISELHPRRAGPGGMAAFSILQLRAEPRGAAARGKSTAGANSAQELAWTVLTGVNLSGNAAAARIALSTRPSMISLPPPMPCASDADRRRASCSHRRRVASFCSRESCGSATTSCGSRGSGPGVAHHFVEIGFRDGPGSLVSPPTMTPRLSLADAAACPLRDLHRLMPRPRRWPNGRLLCCFLSSGRRARSLLSQLWHSPSTRDKHVLSRVLMKPEVSGLIAYRFGPEIPHQSRPDGRFCTPLQPENAALELEVCR